MGYKIINVLIDTYDYSAVTWGAFRDSVSMNAPNELQNALEQCNDQQVASIIGSTDIDTVHDLVQDFNDADGAVIIVNDRYKTCIDDLMAAAGM